VAAIALFLLTPDFPALQGVADLALWGTMIFSLASAGDYVRQFWHKIDESIKERRRMELLKLEKDRQREALKAAAAARGERSS